MSLPTPPAAINQTSPSCALFPRAGMTEQGTPGKISKIPKACEACRGRKQKCDGQRPCSTCVKRETPCSYRAVTRHRGRKPLLSTALNPLSIRQDDQSDPTVAGSSRALSTEENHCVPPRVHIFNNIRASHEPSGSETYYGASSSISLLLHIYNHLHVQAQPANNSGRNLVEDHDGTEGIKRYNYQSIAFNKLPPSVKNAGNCLFISRHAAEGFLRNFILSWLYRMPFLDSDSLYTLLDQLYGNDAGTPITPTEKSIIIISLALGATPTPNSNERQHLLAQAHTEAETTMYDASLRAVQISLLMAQCEFENGNPNMCYLQLGSAIRKAFASGIYRINRPEARKTMWTIFCNETLICVKLGRRCGLTEADVPSLISEGLDYSKAFARLCIIIRLAYNIYYHKNTTIRADLEQANALYDQILDFSSRIGQELDLKMSAPIYALEGEKLFWHIAISYLYYFSIMLTYRPFLVLHIECERRFVVTGNRVDTVDLGDATTRCTQSARSIIQLSQSLMSLGIRIEAICHNAYYLESACFVLVLAASQRDNSSAEYIDLVKTGLESLKRLPQRDPIPCIISAIEQMLDRLTVLSSNAIMTFPASGTSIGPRHNPSNTAPVDSSGVPIESNPQDFAGFYQGDDFEKLWSTIDWNMAFPSLDPDLPTIV